MLYPNGKKTPPTSASKKSEFGPRESPGGIGTRIHQGWDSYGYTYNCAVMDGVVTSTAYNSGWGNLIKVDHGGGVTSWYAHNKSGGVLVKVGQRVKMGQPLGVQGRTGNATGVHLHIEIRINNVPVNPRTYIAQRITDGPLSGGSAPTKPSEPAQNTGEEDMPVAVISAIRMLDAKRKPLATINITTPQRGIVAIKSPTDLKLLIRWIENDKEDMFEAEVKLNIAPYFRPNTMDDATMRNIITAALKADDDVDEAAIAAKVAAAISIKAPAYQFTAADLDKIASSLGDKLKSTISGQVLTDMSARLKA
jgi:hypothetical protein